MSGLLAGCHAIVFDGSRVMNLDGFAAVPSAEGELTELSIPFGDEPVVYSIGAASCAVPGLPAALGELWERLGRLPWARLCEPALELARSGVPLPEMHARSLEMFGELYSLERRPPTCSRATAASSARASSSASPGSRRRSKRSPRRAPPACIADPSPKRCSRVDGLVISADDLAGYRPLWRDPEVVELYGRRVATRGGLSGVPELLPRLPRLAGLTATERVLALVDAFEPVPAGGEHTTNMVAVDAHGRACVLTHSLGVGAGVWLPGLRHTAQQPARRVRHRRTASRSRAITSRAGWHRRSCSTATGSSSRSARRERRACEPRWPPFSRRSSTRASTPRPPCRCRASTPRSTSSTRSREWTRLRSTTLEETGRTVRRWDRLHHYFGGVSCVGRAGAAGDPRRSGAARLL